MANMIRTFLLTFASVLFVAGCGSDEDTSGSGSTTVGPGGGSGDATPPVVAAQPRLVLVGAPRGQFLPLGQTVAIGGRVEPGSGNITSLKVNGLAAQLRSDNTFEYALEPKSGSNLVDVRVEADDGGRAVDAFTFFGGEVHPSGQRLSRGMLVHLGPAALDNNTVNPDDIAGILQAMFADDGFGQSFAGRTLGDDEDAVIQSLVIGSADVDLAPVVLEDERGCLDLRLRVGSRESADDNIELDIRVSGLWAVLGENIHISASEAILTTKLCPNTVATEAGQAPIVLIEAEQTEVELTSLEFYTEENPNIAEEIPDAYDLIKDLADQVMAETIATSLGDLVRDFLEGFELNEEFGTDVKVKLKLDLEELRVNAQGMDLTMAATFAADRCGLNYCNQEGIGSLKTDDAAPTERISNETFAVAISDDASNQLLFAFWWGGLLNDFGLAQGLANADLSTLPDLFQPDPIVTVDASMPPTLLRTSQAGFHADLALGEVNVEVSTGDNRTFRVHVHTRAAVAASVAEDNRLTLDMDSRARRIKVHTGVREAPAGIDPGDVAALVRMIVPSLLGQAKGALPGFSIPSLAIDEIATTDSLRGMRVGMANGKLRNIVPEDPAANGGYLVMEGGLEARRQ